jgi:hypothetical protein
MSKGWKTLDTQNSSLTLIYQSNKTCTKSKERDIIVKLKQKIYWPKFVIRRGAGGGGGRRKRRRRQGKLLSEIN